MALFESVDKLYFLGIGIPLIFQFACFCIASLTIMSITYSFWAIYYNSSKSVCLERNEVEEGYCGREWATISSIGNTELSLKHTEKLLTILTFLVFLVMRVWYFRDARKKESKLCCENLSPSDYTVMITGIPRNSSEKEVRRIFESFIGLDCQKMVGNFGSPQGIFRVNFAYHLSDYIRYSRLKNNLIKKIFKEKLKVNPNRQKILIGEEYIRQYDQKLAVLREKYCHLRNRKEEMFTGICFVTFQNVQDRNFVLDKWKVNFFSRLSLKYLKFLQICHKSRNLKFKGKSVILKEPPEPSDILWENLGTSIGELVCLRLASFLFMMAILGFSFFVVLALKHLQITYKAGEYRQFRKNIVSMAISLVIVIINLLLGLVARQITTYEKHKTLTDYNGNVIRKITLVRQIEI